MKCAICGMLFLEGELELSHDIPKYLGGIDADGRHYLCNDCHDWYERKILESCCELFLQRSIPKLKGRRFLIPYMTMIKNSSVHIKNKCFDLANEIKKEVFTNVKG